MQAGLAADPSQSIGVLARSAMRWTTGAEAHGWHLLYVQDDTARLLEAFRRDAPLHRYQGQFRKTRSLLTDHRIPVLTESDSGKEICLDFSAGCRSQ